MIYILYKKIFTNFTYKYFNDKIEYRISIVGQITIRTEKGKNKTRKRKKAGKHAIRNKSINK